MVAPSGSGVAQPALEKDARIFDYVKACNPDMPQIPVLAHPPELHQNGASRVIPFNIGEKFGVDYAATSPNLLAFYVRVLRGEAVDTAARATSQAFYVIRGQGRSVSAEHGNIAWAKGDLFVLPATAAAVTHHCIGGEEDAAIYWVSDEPLLKYLGVSPCEKKFEPTLFTRERMLATVEELRHEPGVEHKNRLGILLGNRTTETNTLTLTHTLWSLLNLLPGGGRQRPHRHNSVALDLCVSGPAHGAYTLMGPELGEDGWVKNPIRVDWAEGGAFVTPPGWWHSHHNDSTVDAWVLPLQDAGLHTHMRTLDIQFAGGSAVLSSTPGSPATTAPKSP